MLIYYAVFQLQAYSSYLQNVSKLCCQVIKSELLRNGGAELFKGRMMLKLSSANGIKVLKQTELI